MFCIGYSPCFLVCLALNYTRSPIHCLYSCSSQHYFPSVTHAHGLFTGTALDTLLAVMTTGLHNQVAGNLQICDYVTRVLEYSTAPHKLSNACSIVMSLIYLHLHMHSHSAGQQNTGYFFISHLILHKQQRCVLGAGYNPIYKCKIPAQLDPINSQLKFTKLDEGSQ